MRKKYSMSRNPVLLGRRPYVLALLEFNYLWNDVCELWTSIVHSSRYISLGPVYFNCKRMELSNVIICNTESNMPHSNWMAVNTDIQPLCLCSKVFINKHCLWLPSTVESKPFPMIFWLVFVVLLLLTKLLLLLLLLLSLL